MINVVFVKSLDAGRIGYHSDMNAALSFAKESPVNWRTVSPGVPYFDPDTRTFWWWDQREVEPRNGWKISDHPCTGNKEIDFAIECIIDADEVGPVELHQDHVVVHIVQDRIK